MSVNHKTALVKALTGLLLLLALPLAAQERLRAGIHHSPPLSLVSAKDKLNELVVDLLNAIAAAEDWSLEYAPCGWGACNRQLALGERVESAVFWHAGGANQGRILHSSDRRGQGAWGGANISPSSVCP